jgi:hypothetical protein
MKVVLFAISLWAIAVFAFDGDRRARYRFSEVDERDVEPFRAGQTYKYRLDTQISSGFASISEQHASTRLQAEALIHFQSDRSVNLKLNDIIVASLNREIQNPEQVQPMEMFKEHQIKSEEQRALELPCTFNYADGLVERIQFHPEDKPWSKNIKKSVLNMLQLNLKQRKGQDLSLEQPQPWKQEREQESSMSKSEQQPQKMFVMPETTLEGECQVTYTLNKMNPSNKFNSYLDNDRDSSLKMFNVTKSVDFKQCAKIADIRYGPKIEKPCKNCTDPQDLEERKLDRTTVLRHVVVGTQEKYGIKKVELISNYVFKTLNAEQEAPMRVVVAGRLNYIRIEEGRNDIERGLRSVSTSNKEESLLYSTEQDEQEKLFYMYGDEEFPRKSSPFEKVENKMGKVETLMKKLVNLWSDKKTGIESEATFTYTRLVEILRMCNQEELKNIHSTYKSGSSRLDGSEQRIAQEVIIDALANAGTYNTIKVLAEKILREDIPQTQAIRALAQLKNLPAPSEKQIDVLTQLCQNEKCNRQESCKQVCWLTTGTIMGELCDDDLTVEDALEQKKPLCQNDLKKKFVAKVMSQYKDAETRYEKIILLKTLGNAGLEPSVQELEKIIRDLREEPMVRMQAIDSLRRLRATMPQKLQRVLMPVFQNVRERPEIRMMALSQILATVPEKPILDQIGLTLIRDPSRQVKSYVYGAMKKLSESPVDVEKELSQHLKALVKLANISEEDEENLVRGSQYHRIPVYSRAKKEGFLVKAKSMVGADNVLPKHLAAGLDSYVNGIFQKNSLELSFSQQDLEQWVEKLMDAWMEYQYGESSKKSLRGYRSSNRDASEADNDFRSIIQGLGIRSRSESQHSKNSPYGMFNVRMGDIDYAVLPLEEQLLNPALKKLLTQGQRPSARDLENILDYMQGRPFHAQIASNLLENAIKLPTSAGLPIRMWHAIPILASVEGQIKPQLRGSEVNADIKLHTSIAATHLKRIEIWSPIVNSGVETSQTGSFNLPFECKVQIGEQVQISTKVPEYKFRAIKVNSLPLTFVAEQDWQQQRTTVVKRVENRNLIHRAQHVERIYGQENFGMPLKVHGEVHIPQEKNYQQLVHTAMTSENHLEVVFDPTEATPRSIELTAQGQFFQPADRSSSNHRQLKNFHSKSRFDNEMDQYFEEENDDERQFNGFLDGFEPRKLYKHNVQVQLKTEGGRHEKQAQVEIEAATDPEHRYVKAQLKAKRSPLPTLGESRPWNMETQVQAVLPDTHTSAQQYKRQQQQGQQQQQQQRFVCQVETQWGSEQQQKISLNINGEKARTPEWNQKIQQVERLNTPDAGKLREQMIQKTAFINKFDISAQYNNLAQGTKNALNYAATLLKAWNFWSTKVEMKSNQRDGQVTATVVIDPLTHEHANITLKTPVEIIRIDSMSLPYKTKPFQLVKPSQTQKSVESFTDLVRSYASESQPECKVDNKKIRTFDDVVVKAPLTKCYSVLAKDCSSNTPRFAVLMKKINEEEKALKVIVNGDKIEIEPQNGKLVVKINGRREQDEETLSNYGIEYSQDLVRINTRDISVRFDGEQALMKINPTYKNKQCGLCGHYDDDSEDEFRMSNNDLTWDIKSYHKSYSLVDNECRDDLEGTHQREEYKPLKSHRIFYDSEEEKRGEQKRRRNNNNDYETDPIEKTEVMEYNHKICFSLKPVKACPEESYPQETKTSKISFSCLDRSSEEARRLLRQARRQSGPVDLPEDSKISFVESITVPTTCVSY